MKIFLTLLVILVFYKSLDATPIILQGDSNEKDDTIHFPTDDETASRNAEESTIASTTSTTTVSTTINPDLGSRHLVDVPDNCPEGEKFIAGQCRETFDD
ncbi:hypothetical protein ILUMI_01044 [Ignelater luminosus]|uniref:Secreted protein n=1 Tax=Ignelater luminosus TaxID=2038154 RepID=A0A8K0DKS4_IGNLU|nr:hypothetical protein ILUMI_01044 [Ignelater luminosus]